MRKAFYSQLESASVFPLIFRYIMIWYGRFTHFLQIFYLLCTKSFTRIRQNTNKVHTPLRTWNAKILYRKNVVINCLDKRVNDCCQYFVVWAYESACERIMLRPVVKHKELLCYFGHVLMNFWHTKKRIHAKSKLWWSHCKLL